MKEALLTIGLAVLAVSLLFGAAIVKWSWSPNSELDETLGPVESRPIVPYAPLLESDRFHGVALQIHNRAALPDFKQAINEIADLGADTITLSLAAYQENGSSSTIARGAHSAPTPEELGELITLAKTRGLRVIILPIVLLDNPRGTEWRGKIVPTDPDRWWADYREYIRWYAPAAEAAGADLFMVGSELNRMESSTGRWRTLIRFLRKNYPKLKLSYSSNWDRYWKVAFWNESKPGANDGLDYAGVTSYYELAPEPDSKSMDNWAAAEASGDKAAMEAARKKLIEVMPSVDEIAQAWVEYRTRDLTVHHYRDKLISWQRTIGKPVIFTEVGYFSQVGTANAPWNYCLTGPVSQEEQVNCYKAFLKVWNDRQATEVNDPKTGRADLRSAWDIVGGVTFWEWTISEVTKDNEGYTPKGKLAEQVIRNYFASVRAGQPRQPNGRPATTQPAERGPAVRLPASQP